MLPRRSFVGSLNDYLRTPSNGKHVVMQAPPRSGSSYKHTYSIFLLAVCDAQYSFTLVDIGDYGRHSDGGVLNHSVNGILPLPTPKTLPGTSTGVTWPYVFVGDDGVCTFRPTHMSLFESLRKEKRLSIFVV